MSRLSPSSSNHAALSNQVFNAAVARIVRAAVSAREELSARRIRLALEAEFACDLRASRDLILDVIQATLEEEARTHADDSTFITRRRKLFNAQGAPDVPVREGDAWPKRARRSQTTGSGHKRTHSGERPYACDECDYRCAAKGNLTVHKRIHSGERPFACDECDFLSAQFGHLTEHKRIHSGERPFSCDQCNFRCAQSGHLTEHKRIHSVHVDRPFACDVCDRRCTRRNDLTRHKLTHSNKRLYACDQCDYQCTRRKDLTVHIRLNFGVRHSFSAHLPSV